MGDNSDFTHSDTDGDKIENPTLYVMYVVYIF